MQASLGLGALALGFLGSAHCAAMCAGFARARGAEAFALHAGRIASYAVAGALAGALGAAPAAWIDNPVLRLSSLALACAILFATGLRLGGLVRAAPSPAVGRAFDRVGGIAARYAGGPGSGTRRFALGVLWGWAPCGLVYAALPIALVSGSPSSGGLAMAAFGLGTVPALLGAGWILHRLGHSSRRFAGVLLMLLAVAAFAVHAASDPFFCR